MGCFQSKTFQNVMFSGTHTRIWFIFFRIKLKTCFACMTKMRVWKNECLYRMFHRQCLTFEPSKWMLGPCSWRNGWALRGERDGRGSKVFRHGKIAIHNIHDVIEVNKNFEFWSCFCSYVDLLYNFVLIYSTIFVLLYNVDLLYNYKFMFMYLSHLNPTRKSPNCS